MIPLRDDNPAYSPPIVTIALIVINSLVFLYAIAVLSLDRAAFQYGLIPAFLLHQPIGVQDVIAAHVRVSDLESNLSPAWLTIFTSMFMHGGWLHIIGNMWYLWIFGNNVEDVMGKPKFILFYFICGVGAALGQAFLSPHSLAPMVGASGAIAGVLGAYLFFFPRSRVLCLVPLVIIWTTLELPAFVVLLLWFGIQLFHTFTSLGADSGGVAVAAHVGGFAVGWLIARFLRSDNGPPTSRTTPRPDFMDWR